MARGLVIIGCGWIARRHAVAARRLGLPLLVASRDAGRARDFARRFGAVDAFGSYADALADPRASGAIICTPHDRHGRDARLALAAGKHVLVEKPITRTLDEAEELIGEAVAAGRVLMVAENFRFMPGFRYVAAQLVAGVLGPLRELHLMARGFREHTDWRLGAEAMGGGALIDGGIHYVHTLRWWGGEVRRVFALAPPKTLTRMGGEDAVDLLAEHAGGVVGFLANSLGARGLPRFQWSTITGTEGACFVDNRGRGVLIRSQTGTRLRFFRRDLRGHEAMLRSFGEAMARGRASEMDGEEGRRDLAVVVAAYRSIAEGRPVDLPC